MKCPNCGKETDFELFETSDDYMDGIVDCLECGKTIASFNYTVITEDNDE